MLSLDEVLQEARKNGRICPQPLKWHELYKLLLTRVCTEAGSEPPLPLILAAWHETPGMMKMLRLEEHIRWAEKEGVLKEVHDFLKQLKPDDWFCVGD